MKKNLCLSLSVMAGLSAPLGAVPTAVFDTATDTVFTTLSAADYPITSTHLPGFTHQVPAEGEAVVTLEYPVYERLTADETRLLRQNEWDVPVDSIRVTARYGVSRKQGLLDISFCPIVQRGGHLYRLTSCKIVVTPSSAARTRALAGVVTPKATVVDVAARWASQSVLATGRWVKIRVAEEGVYSLTAAQLAAWGFSDASRVKVYGYGGRPQNEAWTFSGAEAVPDDLCEVPLYHDGDRFLFFAEGTTRWNWNTSQSQWVHTPQTYSSYSYYFITEGDAPQAFPTLTATTAPRQRISTFTHHAVLDTDAAAIYAGGRQLYDSHNFATDGRTKSYRLDAPGMVEGENAKVYITAGASNASSTTPVTVSLDGETLTTMSINKYGSDESGRERRTTVQTKRLSATNTFTLSANTTSETRLNFIRLTYPCRLDAAALTSSFTPRQTGSATLVVSGVDSQTRLWRLADAEHVAAEVTGQQNGDTLTADVDDATARYVLLNLGKSYPTPEYVGTVENQNLHADSLIDMVIIIPESGKLREEAERLASAHALHDGLRVKVVNAGALYNEFSSGTPDASAYRRYMKMLYDRATTEAAMPRYLLLMGDCAWDNRMITDDWKGYSPSDFLLSFEVNDYYNNIRITDISLGTLRCYVTDDFYTWLDDSEGTGYESNKSDVAVGRFPCHEAADAKVLVDKAIAYMNNTEVGGWRNKAYVLGDEGDNQLHMRGAETVATMIQAANPSLLLHKVYWDAYPRTMTATGFSYPQVTTKLQEYMRQGALLFNYVGHGSPSQLSHAGLLYTKDFTVDHSGRFPLWIFASCEISPYDTQREDIGRAAIFNKNGGAIAVICASRSVYASYNTALASELITSLLGGKSGGRLGEAMRQTKVALVSGGSNSDGSINKLKYVLLGDPALRLGAPTASMVLDSISGVSLDGDTPVTLRAGQVARFSGRVVTENGEVDGSFDGVLTATLSDHEEQITCLNNAGDSSGALIYRDRPTTLFEGSDSVRQGRFELRVVIPRDISYSGDTGRLTLYATNSAHSVEASGYNEQFVLNGTDSNSLGDTIPPVCYVYLDTPEFVDGGMTSTTPTLMADVSDNIGLSTSGGSIGHDMELVIDGARADALTLNDYFTYNFGDYRSGMITYPLGELTEGRHTLELKVWDINDNATTSLLTFTARRDVPAAFSMSATQNPATTSTSFVTLLADEDVVDGATLTMEVYNAMGQRVWLSQQMTTRTYLVTPWTLCDTAGAPLPSGLYLYKATMEGAGGKRETKAQKLIIIRK
jgi:hypothetical protein